MVILAKVQPEKIRLKIVRLAEFKDRFVETADVEKLAKVNTNKEALELVICQLFKSLEPECGVTQQEEQHRVEHATVSEPNVVSDSVEGKQPSEIQETKEVSTPFNKLNVVSGSELPRFAQKVRQKPKWLNSNVVSKSVKVNES